jgi:hypothetical protein
MPVATQDDQDIDKQRIAQAYMPLPTVGASVPTPGTAAPVDQPAVLPKVSEAAEAMGPFMPQATPPMPSETPPAIQPESMATPTSNMPLNAVAQPPASPQAPPDYVAPNMRPTDTTRALERVTALQGNQGMHHFNNPFGNVMAHVGETIGNVIAPNIMRQIPGTALQKAGELARATQAYTTQQGAESAATKNRLEEAQAKEAEAMPEIKEQLAQNAIDRVKNEMQHWDDQLKLATTEEGRKAAADQLKDAKDKLDNLTKENIAKLNAGVKMFGQGGTIDEQGHFIPASSENLSPVVKNHIALQNAQADKYKADADYAEARAQGDPVRVQAALLAAQNANARVNSLMVVTPEGQVSRVSVGGQMPEGGMTPNQFSASNAKAGNPTTAEQNKAAQAKTVIAAGEDLKSYIDSHKDAFGNVGSYWKDFVNGTPVADPVISQFQAQLASYAALQAAAHGFRGSNVMLDFEKKVGGAPKNPAAIKAAIDGIAATMKQIEKQGVRGGGAPAAAGNQNQPPKISNANEYNALPKGAKYIGSDGQLRTKQ